MERWGGGFRCGEADKHRGAMVPLALRCAAPRLTRASDGTGRAHARTELGHGRRVGRPGRGPGLGCATAATAATAAMALRVTSRNEERGRRGPRAAPRCSQKGRTRRGGINGGLAFLTKSRQGKSRAQFARTFWAARKESYAPAVLVKFGRVISAVSL